jgi:hypothetical protein
MKRFECQHCEFTVAGEDIDDWMLEHNCTGEE